MFQGGNGAFEVDRSSGVITQTRRLDRELTSNYELKVTASNDGYVDMTGSAGVIVSIEDMNDNAPDVQFPTTADRLLVQLSRHTALGTLVTRVDATDPDDG